MKRLHKKMHTQRCNLLKFIITRNIPRYGLCRCNREKIHETKLKNQNERKKKKNGTYSQTRALVVSLCVSFRLPVRCLHRLVAVACEFIKINIIIFSTNCFSSNTFTHQFLFLSLALFFPFVHAICSLL